MKKYIAEFIGTFALMFLGTTAILLHNQSGVIPPIGIVFTFGITLFLMIFLLGKISGAHFNPAVSIGLAVAGIFPPKEILPYIISQLIGAFTAILFLSFLFPFDEKLGATLPNGELLLSFLLEVVFTFILMFVILLVATSKKTNMITVSFCISMVIVLAGIFIGHISGASLNPARSLAPALVSGHTEHIWMYICAPLIGAILGVFIWKLFQKTTD